MGSTDISDLGTTITGAISTLNSISVQNYYTDTVGTGVINVVRYGKIRCLQLYNVAYSQITSTQLLQDDLPKIEMFVPINTRKGCITRLYISTAGRISGGYFPSYGINDTNLADIDSIIITCIMYIAK